MAVEIMNSSWNCTSFKLCTPVSWAIVTLAYIQVVYLKIIQSIYIIYTWQRQVTHINALNLDDETAENVWQQDADADSEDEQYGELYVGAILEDLERSSLWFHKMRVQFKYC